MCDYSLQAFKSRPAVVGENLVTRDFGTGTRGFSPTGSEVVAVCVLPGTELAFEEPVKIFGGFYGCEPQKQLVHSTARFRQVDKDRLHIHHDQLEFPDGTTALLTALMPGQIATVLQLPAAPKTEAEVEEQRRVEVVG
jgi:hypothetical protein